MNKLLIRIMNSFFPYFGKCARCGRNWGWTKFKVHPTVNGSGIFLFCVDCDKVVTPEERWQALDDWKADCLSQLSSSQFPNLDKDAEGRKIRETEFTEFPRREDVISGI